MNEKEKAFVAELTALLKKYGVEIVVHDDYDGDDNLCGSHCNFEGKDIRVSFESFS